MRELEILPQHGQGDQQGDDHHEAAHQPRGDEDAEAIREVVNRLQEELVDETVADFLADLVVLVERADEELQNQERNKVSDGLPEGESAETAGAAQRRRAPEDDHGGEVEERKKTAHRKVEPVDNIALQASEEDLTVFVESGEHGGRESS